MGLKAALGKLGKTLKGGAGAFLGGALAGGLATKAIAARRARRGSKQMVSTSRLRDIQMLKATLGERYLSSPAGQMMLMKLARGK